MSEENNKRLLQPNDSPKLRAYPKVTFSIIMVHLRTSPLLCISICTKSTPPLNVESWSHFILSWPTGSTALWLLSIGKFEDFVHCEPLNTICEPRTKWLSGSCNYCLRNLEKCPQKHGKSFILWIEIMGWSIWNSFWTKYLLLQAIYIIFPLRLLKSFTIVAFNFLQIFINTQYIKKLLFSSCSRLLLHKTFTIVAQTFTAFWEKWWVRSFTILCSLSTTRPIQV